MFYRAVQGYSECMLKLGVKAQTAILMNKYFELSLFSLLLLLTLSGCKSGAGPVAVAHQKDRPATSYFASPEAAVPMLTQLLKDKDYKALAAYYDLSGSDIECAELESGEFFERKERPERAHPAGFWRYKHPFAPGFKFSSTQATDRAHVFMVEVSIEIDQGVGSPVQISRAYFYMRKSQEGWKLLPEKASPEPSPEIKSRN